MYSFENGSHSDDKNHQKFAKFDYGGVLNHAILPERGDTNFDEAETWTISSVGNIIPILLKLPYPFLLRNLMVINCTRYEFVPGGCSRIGSRPWTAAFRFQNGCNDSKLRLPPCISNWKLVTSVESRFYQFRGCLLHKWATQFSRMFVCKAKSEHGVSLS